MKKKSLFKSPNLEEMLERLCDKEYIVTFELVDGEIEEISLYICKLDNKKASLPCTSIEEALKEAYQQFG